MGFVARIHGRRRMNEGMMRMLEPYLLDLLNPAPEKNEVAVPKNHWTHGVIHSLLASYHLALFPQSFGKGLAAQLGLTVQGLEEALVYIEFLNNTIRTHPTSINGSASHGNLMAAFFAGWRILTLVIDLVMDSTEDKYANVVYERDSDSDVDSDDSDDEGENKSAPTPATSTHTDTANSTEESSSEAVLIPLNQEWVAPLTKISEIVNNEWIPLVEQVFTSHQSVVVQDMITQIKSFDDRIKKTTPSSTSTN
ncbi:hypothetical protein G6F42_019044 [Rhizopus arrhizus]|nr:hypothetical protein G6F42_019044 [Rhizopus arrhizus]